MNDKTLAIALFALLERENTVSIPQIAKLLGASEETVWELLEDLLFAYDSVQVRLELGKSSAHLVRNETSRVLRLTQEETALLLDALEAHGVSADSELVRKLLDTKGFLGQARETAASTDSTPVDSVECSIRTRSHGTKAEVFELVASACESIDHQVLRLEYHKEGATSTQERLVEPYAIRSDGDYSLLEAFDRDRGAWRTFRIDRIKSARLLDERFVPKTPTDNGTHPSATLLFAEGRVPQDWPGLKKGRTHSDGCIEATIPWYGSLWLPKHIIAHGKTKVLNPPELAEAVVDYAKRLLD